MKRLFSLITLFVLLASCSQSPKTCHFCKDAKDLLYDDILKLAEQNMTEVPLTITADYCERSTGGKHDFFSEGDYWWADSLNPEGPYVQRDGMTNPDNFTAHRKAMIRFSTVVGNLTSAYLITREQKYVDAARTHIKAWFVEENTRMNPNLLYAQAIKGRHTGRGIGIIDAIHLMEVAQSVRIYEDKGLISGDELRAVKKWFGDFTEWLTTHPYGKAEMVHPNNHGTCWNMQVAIFSKLAEKEDILAFCYDNFINTLLPNQMALDGSFPLELARTKPYGYSLFNLDAFVMNALILSDDAHNLWEYELADGRGIKKAINYMTPYVADKSSWPLPADVMFWNNWPVAHPAFLFGALKYSDPAWFDLWKNNEHFPQTEEVIRNLPIRNPLLWTCKIR